MKLIWLYKSTREFEFVSVLNQTWCLLGFLNDDPIDEAHDSYINHASPLELMMAILPNTHSNRIFNTQNI